MDTGKYYRPLVRFFIYAYSVTAFTYMFAGPDLWGHLKFGQDIWESGAIPATDPFSYTAPGHEWINHEWFSELLIFWIYDLFGAPGWIVFRLLLGLGIVHLLSQLYFSKSKNWLVYGICFFLFINAISTGFLIRPQLATFTFVPLLLYCLHRYFDGDRKYIYAIPLMMLVWVNSHGGFVAGFGMFGMVVAVESVRRLFNKEPLDTTLLGAFGVCCLALLCNPYGYKLLTFLLETIPRRRDITEWTGIEVFDLSHLDFKLLVVLFVISLFSNKKKPAWLLALVAFSVFYGFKHHRHAVIASMVLLAFVPMHLAALLERLPEKWTGWTTRIPKPVHALLMLFLMLEGALEVSLDAVKLRDLGFTIQVDANTYPVHAMQFLRENDINGNILVPFNWGEYVLYHRPESKISMDGRYWTVYPPQVFKQNLVFERKWNGWEHYLDLYPHEVVLMYAGHGGLDGHPHWMKLYQDSLAALYIRTGGGPNPAWKRLQPKIVKVRFPEPALTFP